MEKQPFKSLRILSSLAAFIQKGKEVRFYNSQIFLLRFIISEDLTYICQLMLKFQAIQIAIFVHLIKLTTI